MRKYYFQNETEYTEAVQWLLRVGAPFSGSLEDLSLNIDSDHKFFVNDSSLLENLQDNYNGKICL